MTWPRIWRGPLGLSFRHCLRACTIPGGIAVVVAGIAQAISAPEVDGAQAAAAATPWLTLPLLTVAVACCLSAAHIWPLFAQRQPGVESIRRIERGPCGGRVAIIVGALAAQLLLSMPLAIGMSWWLDAPRQASRYHLATGPAEAFLNDRGDRLTFALASEHPVASLLLRPRAALPTGVGATEISVTTQGKQLNAAPATFTESGALLRIDVEPQRLRELQLTKTAGHVPLWFPERSVIAVGPAELPTWRNSLLAALVATWSSAITLVIAAVVGLGTGWTTLATAISCLLFVQWIGGVGPIEDALLQVMRGQWLW